jgi:ribosomal protein L29
MTPFYESYDVSFPSFFLPSTSLAPHLRRCQENYIDIDGEKPPEDSDPEGDGSDDDVEDTGDVGDMSGPDHADTLAYEMEEGLGMALPVGTPSETKLSTEQLQERIAQLKNQLPQTGSLNGQSEIVEIDDSLQTPGTPNSPQKIHEEPGNHNGTESSDPAKIESLQKQIAALKSQSEVGTAPTAPTAPTFLA